MWSHRASGGMSAMRLWGSLVGGFDWVGRFFTLLGWLSALSVSFGILWIYLLTVPVLWWPVVAVICFIAAFLLAGAILFLVRQLDAHGTVKEAEKYATAFVAAVRVVLEEQHRSANINLAPITGTVQITGHAPSVKIAGMTATATAGTVLAIAATAD